MKILTKTPTRALTLLIITFWFTVSVSHAAVYTVSTVAELYDAVAAAGPGDEVRMNDGVYENVNLVVNNDGTSTNRIQIYAINGGQVSFTGNMRIRIFGDYVTFKGVKFENGAVLDGYGELITIKAKGVRLTDCVIDGIGQHTQTATSWVYILQTDGTSGTDIRIDHCKFINKTTNGNTLYRAVPGNDVDQNMLIDRNYFSRPRGTENGCSSIRLGGTNFGNNPEKRMGCTVEYNLFEHADGEDEIITLKSSNNIVRYNTFRDCRGNCSLRDGNYNDINNNFFLRTPSGPIDCGGTNIWGSGHTVWDNYYGQLKPRTTYNDGAISLQSGDTEDLGTGHPVARNCDISGNTIVYPTGSSGYCLCLSRKDNGIEPYNITFSDNVFLDSNGDTLINEDGNPGNNLSWSNNIAWEGPVGINPIPSGITVENPNLSPDADGIYRPSWPLGSPLVESNVGPTWLPVPGDVDMDGDVNFADYVILANQWHQPPGFPSADIAPPPDGDGIVDSDDLMMLIQNWLIIAP